MLSTSASNTFASITFDMLSEVVYSDLSTNSTSKELLMSNGSTLLPLACGNFAGLQFSHPFLISTI